MECSKPYDIRDSWPIQPLPNPSIWGQGNLGTDETSALARIEADRRGSPAQNGWPMDAVMKRINGTMAVQAAAN